MNVFKKELRLTWKALAVWCIFVLFLTVVGKVNYGTMAASGDDFAKMLDSMPPALMGVAGIGSNMDLTKPDGFYALMTIFTLYITVFHAAFLGAKLIGREEEEHTAEFLYTKPASRRSILTQKLLSGVISCVILNLFTLIASLAVYTSLDVSSNIILLFALYSFIVGMLYLCLGAVCAAVIKKPGKAGAASLCLVLFTLFFAKALDFMSIGGVWWILSPFKYFDPNSYLFGGGVEPLALPVAVIVLGASVLTMFVTFNKRDINA